MRDEDRHAIDRMRGIAARHRRMAEIHDAFGETQKASNCRALAHLEEQRALRLERRGSAT